VLLRAFSLLIERAPHARLLLVGRGTHIEETVIRPIRELGIEGKAILAGYRKEDYVDTLASLDIFVLISPGSDGTARALREAMAMGKPAVITQRGMLPELAEGCALVVREDPEEMSRALLTLIEDRALREEMGRRAYRRSRERFRWEDQVKRVITFYEHLLEDEDRDRKDRS